MCGIRSYLQEHSKQLMEASLTNCLVCNGRIALTNLPGTGSDINACTLGQENIKGPVLETQAGAAELTSTSKEPESSAAACVCCPRRASWSSAGKDVSAV